MLSRPHSTAVCLAIALATTGQLACEKDVVLPSVATPAICGNGVVESGEECDNTSPGCIGCQVAPEWTCPGNECSVSCDDPGVTATGLYCARAATCNMAGFWAVRETDYTATAECTIQTSTQWYLYHLTQGASDATYAIDTALDCGIHVTGAATVDYTPHSQENLMYASGIDRGPHAPRTGDAAETEGGCKVSLNRFFFIRGATSAYLPSNFDNDASLPSSATEPWLDAPVLPAQPGVVSLTNDTHFPSGAVNTDGTNDAGVQYPGVALRITGSVNGTRHSAQRDYKGYAATSPVARSSLSFTFPGNYSLQESVLSVTNCNPLVCGFLQILATPDLDLPPHVTFSYIGLLPTSTRTKSVVVGVPKADYTSDLATCNNIRLILPHDGSIHDGSAPPDAATP